MKHGNRLRILVSTLLILPGLVHADILRLAIQEGNKVEVYTWPVLPKVDGWHHDRKNSLHFRSNAQAPDGTNFMDAETVIYAKAIFKPSVPYLFDVDDLISNDRAQYSSGADIRIAEVAPLAIANGIELRSLTFTPVGEGLWEQVAYGEEGEFFLLFTISSRSRAGFEKSWAAFESFVTNYEM